VNASKPPADAPMPTIGNRLSFCFSRCELIWRGSYTAERQAGLPQNIEDKKGWFDHHRDKSIIELEDSDLF
jgi:hypothetical protein